MEKVLDFFGSAKGWVLTLMGAGSGLAPEVLDEPIKQSVALHPIQIIVLYLTAVVTAMTIISYIYKFIKWCRNNYKCLKIKKPSK